MFFKPDVSLTVSGLLARPLVPFLIVTFYGYLTILAEDSKVQAITASAILHQAVFMEGLNTILFQPKGGEKMTVLPA